MKTNIDSIVATDGSTIKNAKIDKSVKYKKRKIWVWGFISGIIASLIASWIWHWIEQVV